MTFTGPRLTISTQDPREYLPYLQSLHKLSSRRQKFHIDDDLRRHGKALEHLHFGGHFLEFLEYVEKYDLYQKALTLCRHEHEKLKEVMNSYANTLKARNSFKESGIGIGIYNYISFYLLIAFSF